MSVVDVKVPPYDSVNTLLLSWKDCEEPIKNQLEKLQDAIKHYYNYGVEHWEIPKRTPYRSLDRKLSLFMDEFDGPKNLLIFYYGGHAIKHEAGGGIIWTLYNDPETPALSWRSLQQKLLVDVEADVLILLDCCYASSSVQILDEEAGSLPTGAVTLLGAGSYDEEVPLRGNYTFTQNLVAQIEVGSIKRQKIDKFWRQMLRRAQSWQALQFPGERNMVKVPNIVNLTADYVSRTICLDRFERKQETKQALRPLSAPLGANEHMRDASGNKDGLNLSLQLDLDRRMSSHNLPRQPEPDQSEKQYLAVSPEIQPYPGVQYIPKKGLEPARREIIAAQTWLEQLDMIQELLYQEIEDSPHHNHEARANIKVAILASGIDARRPTIKAAQKSGRLVATRNFASDGGPENDDDSSGYGSDGVVSLLRMTKYANLYVARTGGLCQEDSAIAKAIHYCVDPWDVDLIIMPFGQDSFNQEIDGALRRAAACGKIMMAASGNSWPPGKTDLGYPASSPDVIAIFSTDGYGYPSCYNFPARKSRKNFATLGEAVPSFWKSQKLGRTMSGTSISLHVAAALVCTALVYANSTVIRVEHDRRLFSQRGVEALLGLMSKPKSGYDYVVPWNLWNEERNPNEVRTLIKEAIHKL